jgi:spermidine/putrescine transport system ATP-binding protein
MTAPRTDDAPAPSPPGHPPVVRIRGVGKGFGAVRVLDGLDLDIAPGEFLTLLGPSGCGKTTLLRIIAGLDHADAGTVEIAGVDAADLPPQKRPVNTVFQNYALFPHLSVRENVAFGLRSRKVPEAEVASRVGEVLELVRIAELGERRPETLSGGQKQRVALARAVVNRPAVLLLDEPMSALDARLRVELQGELRRLQKRLGTAFVLVTHDQDEAMAVSDRVVVMNAGRIEQAGTPREVYDRPASRFVAEFVGAANVLEARAVGPRRVSTPVGEFETGEPVPAGACWLCVRPERLLLARDPGGLVVRESIFRGDCAEVLLDSGLKAELPAEDAPAVGERVSVRVEPAYARVLDA